ncbi:hypothetical protein [Saccharopolyspora spinosa]|uniref:hypothetical protein n=1 Tax=Saccharopolyspora spinosa TaxID=60894 RepID=UPI0002D2EFAB|nr:hypothetical protein [Saccharopolyspora spinosa]
MRRTPAELAVAEDFVARPDAAERGAKLLDAAETRALNPALRGEILAELWCEQDGAVESRTAQPALRAHEDPYELKQRAEELLGRPLPRIVRRWAGVYTQTFDKSRVAHREQALLGVWSPATRRPSPTTWTRR